MDVIFFNGRINTLDDSDRVCTALGATNGIVSALGSDEELRRTAGPGTETVDLDEAQRDRLRALGYVDE